MNVSIDRNIKPAQINIAFNEENNSFEPVIKKEIISATINPIIIHTSFQKSKYKYTFDPPVVRSPYGYDDYEGPYVAVPSVSEFQLQTDDKHMLDNITIKEIPFAMVSNTSGYTVTIGG